MYVKCMYACITNHVCMYMETKMQFTNHQNNPTKKNCFLFTIHGDNRYNGINVHPIGISHIIFKFEITSGFIEPI
jgi:hypothetical protein